MDASVNSLTSLLHLIDPPVLSQAATKSRMIFEKGGRTRRTDGNSVYKNVVFPQICMFSLVMKPRGSECGAHMGGGERHTCTGSFRTWFCWRGSACFWTMLWTVMGGWGGDGKHSFCAKACVETKDLSPTVMTVLAAVIDPLVHNEVMDVERKAAFDGNAAVWLARFIKPRRRRRPHLSPPSGISSLTI